MEVFKFILTNYGPVIASVVLMVYLCFFTKKAVNGEEKKLKDDLAMTLRENAELKVELKKAHETMNKAVQVANEKYEELSEQIDLLIKESEEDVQDNPNS